MKLDWWTLGLQTINVVILIWLLSRFLFKPVAGIVAERQRLARQLLDEAAAAKQAAEDERAQAAAASAQLAGQRASALQAAEQEAAATKAQLLKQAEAEAAQLREQAATAQAAQQQAAQALAEQRAASLALDIAAKLLDRLPAGARVAGFAAGLVAGLDELPPASRQTLAADPRPLRLRAPRALAADELAACRAALSTALGQPLELEVVVDPGLIAGLELEGASMVVRNSFRADLARLQLELNRHDPVQP
jgi:F-type H+-transporting ATPase subunit b